VHFLSQLDNGVAGNPNKYSSDPIQVLFQLT